jgi:HSP20 family molecular chaperone IbpA
MRNLFKNKTTIALIFFILGALLFYLSEKYIFRYSTLDAKRTEYFYNQIFNQDFFNQSRDPFQEMNRLQKRLSSFFNPNTSDSIFQSWSQRKYGGRITDIKTREDNQNIYYDIFIKNIDPQSVSVQIENGIVKISGEEKKESKGILGNSYVSSKFQRFLPIPPSTDGTRYETTKSDDKITIKFFKLPSWFVTPDTV